MASSSTPLWEQVIIVFAGPPVMAFLWRLLSRGWATVVQGGVVSEKTKRRQKWEFWVLLAAMYAAVLSMAVYAWLRKT